MFPAQNDQYYILRNVYDTIYQKTIGSFSHEKITSIALTVLGSALAGAAITTFALGASVTVGSSLAASAVVSLIFAHIYFEAAHVVSKFLKFKNLENFCVLIGDAFQRISLARNPIDRDVLIKDFQEKIITFINKIAYEGTVLSLNSDVLDFVARNFRFYNMPIERNDHQVRDVMNQIERLMEEAQRLGPPAFLRDMPAQLFAQLQGLEQ